MESITVRNKIVLTLCPSMVGHSPGWALEAPSRLTTDVLVYLLVLFVYHAPVKNPKGL